MKVVSKLQMFAAVAVALSLTFASAGQAQAAVPGTMVVEGLLTSTGGGAAADGSYAAVFSIYNVQSGGTAAWTEGSVQIAVKNGQFTHVLGAKTPITAATLGKLTTGWLGLKIGADPELPRQPLHAVAYAMLADTASKLTCSGCLSATQLGAGAVSADKVSFTYAGSKTKGGPANSAIDLACTGCVSVDEMKFDKDVNLGGNALVAGKVTAKDVAATTVQATSFVGDGSKLTGIKIPSGECKTAGEVVKGINPDGTLKCAVAMDPKALPADGIDEISNYLIHNQFVDKTCGKANVKIPDNNPTGVADELTFPDIGLAQKLDIDLTVTNSNLGDVTVKVYDPNNVEYTLIAKSVKGTSLTTSFPSKTKPFKGDLTTWVNKNPKGKWRILAVDGAFLNNTFDGAIVSWCVSIQTLSNKKVQVKGNLIVDGDITSPGGVNVNGPLTLGDTSAACTAANKTQLKYAAGKGLLVCDGKFWVAAKAKPIIYRGWCSSTGSSSWRYFCLNQTSVNTAGDYLSVATTNTGSSDSNTVGRITIKIPGYYRLTHHRYGASYYCGFYMYRNGGDIAHGMHYGATYNGSSNPCVTEATRVEWMNTNDYFNVRFYSANSTNWHANQSHTYVEVEYLGTNW